MCRKHREAAEDDEDSGDQEGQQWTLPVCTYSRRCEGESQSAQEFKPK